MYRLPVCIPPWELPTLLLEKIEEEVNLDLDEVILIQWGVLGLTECFIKIFFRPASMTNPRTINLQWKVLLVEDNMSTSTKDKVVRAVEILAHFIGEEWEIQVHRICEPGLICLEPELFDCDFLERNM